MTKSNIIEWCILVIVVMMYTGNILTLSEKIMIVLGMIIQILIDFELIKKHRTEENATTKT